ncbi:MAG TPA: ABC transporter permease [Spirochaetota bacterium]|nr:ABC transporter permease [Spirochaetota bacterium]HOD15771.1 ABC transporter permease [Spirochaetota bacterium]HPG52580.1 ABC transporter permease [Spirochaetota bacterium]HPN12980.1 ABC transporter permease [Spirochaetota bacterium]
MIRIYQIAYKNLLRKKTRTILTITGISLSAWVLVSLLGFNRGYESALNRDIDSMGYQVLVAAKGCPYEAATLMLKGGTGLRYMNESIAADIMKYNEVRKITPMLMQAVFDPDKGESGGISAYLGVDPATFPGMKGYFKFQQGAWFTDPDANEAVMGYEAAELEQREVGDKILIPEKKVELTVVGVLKRTGTQDDGTIFVPIQAVQRIFGQAGRLTAIGVQVNKNADMAAVEQKMYDLPDVQVVSLAQVKQTIISLVATARVMVLSIAVIAVLIAMVGVVNTILMSVFERFQEIGILKSMGAMPGDVFRLIWIETFILCLAGGIVGNALAFALEAATDLLIRRLLPYSPTGSLVQIDAPLALAAMAAIIGIGLLAGLYPAWRAARIRPIESIRSQEG